MDMQEMEREKIRQDALYQQRGLGKAADPHGYADQCNRVEPVQVSLQDRLRDQAAQARRESRKADRLDELNHLLDKNPEVARILDLLEDVQRY